MVMFYINILVPIDENDQYSATETRYEVMFDDQFLGANNVRYVKITIHYKVFGKFNLMSLYKSVLSYIL